MNNTKLAFLLTMFAGLSTMIGTVFIFKKVKNEPQIITASLSFAAGVMITVSITDLMPKSFSLLQKFFYPIPSFLVFGICFALGVLLSMGIDHFLPDGSSYSYSSFDPSRKKKSLYRIGLISCLAIILHNVPEGIATFMATSNDTKLGIMLATSIALHNIPEGISISVPLYYATKKRGKALLYTFISGISEPFGALLAFLFLKNFMNDMAMGCLLAMIAGIMMHISFYELLPTSFSYREKKITIGYLLIGILFMFLSHILF